MMPRAAGRGRQLRCRSPAGSSSRSWASSGLGPIAGTRKSRLPAQRQVTALAVGSEAESVDRPALAPSLQHLSHRSIGHEHHLLIDDDEGWIAPKSQFEPTTALAGTGAQTRRLVFPQKMRICRGLGVADRIRTGDRLDRTRDWQLSPTTYKCFEEIAPFWPIHPSSAFDVFAASYWSTPQGQLETEGKWHEWRPNG